MQLDRYSYFGSPGSKESRERTPDAMIGTASNRALTKQKVLVQLKEYTGPADPTDPDSPSAFKVSTTNLMTAQRMLLDTGNLAVFHQSVGSLTLLNDYRQWRDLVWINEVYKCYSRGKSSEEQGGYYFPGAMSEAEIASPGYDVTGAGDGDKARFSVKMDLLQVVADMRSRNVPTFPDGLYRAIVDPTFMMHMRQDDDFREVARYAGQGVVNPLQPHLAPNANLFLGVGPAYNQAGFVAGAPAMPVGIVFEGVRFFESTNMPKYHYNVVINGAEGFSGSTPKSNRAAVGMFFGTQLVGIGTGGNNAQIKINSNDDYSRYVILIWQLYAGFENLNLDFGSIAHSFVYKVA